MNSHTHEPGYIQGFVALDRQRAADRRRTAIHYLQLTAVIALLLVGTGTISYIGETPAPPPQMIVVDLTSCPEPTADSLPILTLTVTLSSDGNPEIYRCVRWQRRNTLVRK